MWSLNWGYTKLVPVHYCIVFSYGDTMDIRALDNIPQDGWLHGARWYPVDKCWNGQPLHPFTDDGVVQCQAIIQWLLTTTQGTQPLAVYELATFYNPYAPVLRTSSKPVKYSTPNYVQVPLTLQPANASIITWWRKPLFFSGPMLDTSNCCQSPTTIKQNTVC